MTIWFTSDPHFSHANIITYCDRPFADKQEMNEALIRNWNAVVQPSDLVYMLGDFSFGDEKSTENIARRLAGNKHWIWGNHCKKFRRGPVKNFFAWTGDYLEVKVPDPDAERGVQLIVLCHYPFITWNKAHRGSWHLHGHCHHKLKYPFDAKILDVGVDGHGYTPISYQQVKAIMAKKGFTRVDHHAM